MIQKITMEDIDKIVDAIASYGMKVLFAIIILVAGLWVARKLRGLFKSALEKKEIDATLVGFFSSLLYGALVIFVVIAAIDKLGVQTTSFVAVLGAAGLAVGLALQGSLSNFASGVLLIIFKPFVAGNFVKIGGELGTVVQVGILQTELKSPDNIKIIMPNSQVMSGAITNFSAHDTRRADMVIGVSYSDDLSKVMDVLQDMISKDERVLEEPAPFIGVSELADSSINFVVRPWVKSSDNWQFKCDFQKAVKERFDAEGISIPFPQRDLHVFQENAS
ncbi:mechanosensitive ion channel protein [Coraliomargarita sinensis]|uniref:Mechanosensitive ion channel protein n=2 Tax=Coraliomargarita sinensis TaxID=2174842 RepID=A0A317ZLN4_9BACT|nr:mechanosensitive ion channel protein [Coraliomargarita sinensis]